MDNELLVRLLTDIQKLIIPGFGAFLRKEGVINGSLIFSPFLKRDDGVLNKVLTDQYGVSSEDAQAMISEWVDAINQSLKENGRFHIDGVGMLILDANGAITMINEVRDIKAEAASAALEAAHSEPAHTNEPSEDLAPQSIVNTVIIEEPVETPISEPAPSRDVRGEANQMMENLQQTLQNINQGQSQRPPMPTQPRAVVNNGVGAIPRTVNPNPVQAQAEAAPRPVVGVIPQRPVAHPAPQQQVPTPRPQQHPQQHPAGHPQQHPQQQGARLQPRRAGAMNGVPQQRPTGAHAPQQGASRMAPPAGVRPQRPTSSQRPAPQQGNGTRMKPMPQRPQGAAPKGKPNMPMRRKPNKGRSPQSAQKKKVEMLLIIAIIVATLITVLIIYSLLTTNPTTELYLP